MMGESDRPQGAAAATIAWFAPTKRLTVYQAGDTAAFHYDGTGVTRLTHEHGTGRAIDRYMGEAPGLLLDHETVAFDEGDVLCLVTDG